MVGRYAPEYGGKVRGLTPNAIAAIKRHRWPGNIRELENRIKKAVVLSDKALLGPEDLDLTPDDLPPILPLADAKEKFQREYINEILALNNGNRTKTARDLGVDPRTIFRHLEKEEGGESKRSKQKRYDKIKTPERSLPPPPHTRRRPSTRWRGRSSPPVPWRPSPSSWRIRTSATTCSCAGSPTTRLSPTTRS